MGNRESGVGNRKIKGRGLAVPIPDSPFPIPGFSDSLFPIPDSRPSQYEWRVKPQPVPG